MKFKAVAFILLFIVLSIASLYSILLYQQVLTQDYEQGQLISQVKVVKFEYNSSDPSVINGTSSPGILLCNITYYNPTNSALGGRVQIDRPGNLHLNPFTYGYFFTNTSVPGSNYFTATIELDYSELPATSDTSPEFYITTEVSQGITARELGSAVVGSKIYNWVIGRAYQDQTYELLSFYLTVAAIVWIIGLSPAFVIILFVSKSKQQVERWASCVFAVNVYSVCAAFVLAYLPQPAPAIYTPFTPTGAAGGFGEFFVNSAFWLGLILGCALNLYAIASLLRHSSHAKKRYYLAGGFMIAGFPLSFLSPIFYDENGVALVIFALIFIVNYATILRLGNVNLNK